MRIDAHLSSETLRQLFAPEPLPSQSKTYLEPFRDYPSHLLADATPEESARFVVGYVCGHVRYSPLIQLLTGDASDVDIARLSMSLNDIRRRIADELDLPLGTGNVCVVADMGANLVDTDKFLWLTDIVATERIENCGGMCLVGARALKEFGCPHPVTVMNAHANLLHGERGNHAVIRIGNGPAAWIADPFIHQLNEPQRMRLLGFDCPSCWPAFDFQGNGNAPHYLHLTFYPEGREDDPVVRLCRYDELLRTDRNGKLVHDSAVFDAFEVDRTPAGEIVFRVAD